MAALQTESKITALYERLSRDDDQIGDSNSIVNQKKYLESYAQQRGYTNIQHYTDDGWSGGNFERPAWKQLIADIEAGIKKEVSVGCAMGRAICSVCGSEYGSCGHQKGEHYEGMLCCAILKDPVDAYEFSFVAVPAQPNAGVLKGLGRGRRSLKELADEFGAQGEYRALFKEAELGRQYKKQIQDDVVRLCLCLELGADEPTLRAIVEKAGAEELLKLQKALDDRLAESMPMQTQLGGSFGRGEIIESGFLI